MKVAVSVPDDIFEQAEKLAESQGASRSRLYSQALREYLARHAPGQVQEALDSTLDAIDEPADPFVIEAGRLALRSAEW